MITYQVNLYWWLLYLFNFSNNLCLFNNIKWLHNLSCILLRLNLRCNLCRHLLWSRLVHCLDYFWILGCRSCFGIFVRFGCQQLVCLFKFTLLLKQFFGSFLLLLPLLLSLFQLLFLFLLALFLLIFSFLLRLLCSFSLSPFFLFLKSFFFLTLSFNLLSLLFFFKLYLFFLLNFLLAFCFFSSCFFFERLHPQHC